MQAGIYIGRDWCEAPAERSVIRSWTSDIWAHVTNFHCATKNLKRNIF